MIANSFDDPDDLRTFIDAFPEFESEFLPIYEAAIRETRSMPAIVWAASNRDYSLIQKLVAHGANINEAGTTGRMTALHAAVKHGGYRIVETVLQKGADIDSRDIAGATALHHAASIRCSDIIGLLLEAGADIAARDGYQRTVLHYAVARIPSWAWSRYSEGVFGQGIANWVYRPQTLGLLLRRGAMLNLSDADGRTELHYAVDHPLEVYKRITRFLVARGANFFLRDRSQFGMRAYEEVMMRGHMDPDTLNFVIELGGVAERNGFISTTVGRRINNLPLPRRFPD